MSSAPVASSSREVSAPASTEAARRPRLALAAALAACLALAGATLLAPSRPTTDPWGWIVWGREVVHLDLSTAIGGVPSWKPLPVLFTAPFSLLGDVAPTLWVLIARAGGLFGLVAAYLLGRRLGGRAAGLLSAVATVLSAGWLRGFLHAYSEPLVIGFLLLAIERHLAGRRGQALALAAGVSLSRPEAFPLTLLYGAFVWRRGGSRALVAATTLLVPTLWLIPDWLGSGDPFHANAVAHHVLGSGPDATFRSLGQGVRIAPLPLSIAALIGLAIAFRRRDRTVLVLSGIVLGWSLLLTVQMLSGYPASGRFYVLPAAIVCVLGAVAAVRFVELGASPGARMALALGALAAAAPSLVIRADDTWAQTGNAVRRARLEANLDTALERAGPARLRACGTPVLPDGMGWTRGVVAWRLDVGLHRIKSARTSAADAVAALSDRGELPPSPAGSITVHTARRHFFLLEPFGDRPVRLSGRRRRPLSMAGRAGSWRVLLPPACSGRAKAAA